MQVHLRPRAWRGLGIPPKHHRAQNRNGESERARENKPTGLVSEGRQYAPHPGASTAPVTRCDETGTQHTQQTEENQRKSKFSHPFPQEGGDGQEKRDPRRQGVPGVHVPLTHKSEPLCKGYMMAVNPWRAAQSTKRVKKEVGGGTTVLTWSFQSLLQLPEDALCCIPVLRVWEVILQLQETLQSEEHVA